MLTTLPEKSGTSLRTLSTLEHRVKSSPVSPLSRMGYRITGHDLDVVKFSVGVQDYTLGVTPEGLDKLCYRLNRCPPTAYMLQCPEQLRCVNMNHWLKQAAVEGSTVWWLFTDVLDLQLVSVMSAEHVPVYTTTLTAAAGGECLGWRWTPALSTVDLRYAGRAGLRVHNSPTGFGAIRLIPTVHVLHQGDELTLRVPFTWRAVHRWQSTEDLARGFHEAAEEAKVLAEQLGRATDAFMASGAPLHLSWAEALRTAHAVIGRDLPVRAVLPHLPEGEVGTWVDLVKFFLRVAVALRASAPHTAEALEVAVGLLVMTK